MHQQREMPGLTPAGALEPSALYSLYLGALDLDERWRQRACTVILLGGRLGLRAGELQHLHEGWVDWTRGELRLPSHDPCGCSLCCERARQQQRSGDGRRLSTLVTDQQWTPVSGARSVPFGYAQRLTGVLDTHVTTTAYLDCSAERLAELLAESARHATGLDATAIDLETLRATAAAFFADIGVETGALAGLLGVDRDIADRFTQAAGGDTRKRVYESFDEPTPDVHEAYPLLTDPARFEGEPFDPQRYDADWRANRGAKRSEEPTPLRNPRPVADELDDVSFPSPTHLDTDSAVVTTENGHPATSTLTQWVETREDDRGTASGQDDTHGHADTTTTTTADTGSISAERQEMGNSAVLDPRERATRPIVESLSTKLACSGLNNGSPLAGRVVFGQEELVVSDGEGEVCQVIDLDDLTDIAVDYTPPNLDGVFDSSVGIAYDGDGDGELVVIELPGKKQMDVATSLFTLVLSATPVVATHPARKGGRVTDETPAEYILTLESRTLGFTDPEDGSTAFEIRLSDVIYVERDTQTYEDERFRSLLVRHLQASGQVVSTDLAPKDDEMFKLLERFVMRNYEQRKAEMQGLNLSDAQKEVLVAMYSTGEGMDIPMILDKDPEELSELLDSLQRLGLIREAGDGARLTGSGRMVVSDKVDDVNV